MSYSEKLRELRIILPKLGVPVGAYSLYVKTGTTVFVSGHIAKNDGKPWIGQFGSDMSTDDGILAARSVAVDLIATLLAACDGNLDRIKKIVKVMVLVNSTSSFTDQHIIANGASDLLQEIFGEAGVHTRSAFGVAQIPYGACLEIELIAQVE